MLSQFASVFVHVQHIRAADHVIVHMAVIVVCATSVFHTFYAVLVLTLTVPSAVPTKMIMVTKLALTLNGVTVLFRTRLTRLIEMHLIHCGTIFAVEVFRAWR